MFKVTILNGDETFLIHDDDSTSIELPRISGGKVVKSINSVDSFTFTMYPDNPGYKKLNPLTTSIKVRNTQTRENIFIGRVLKCPDSMDSNGLICRQVTCEGRLGWLYDSVQPYKEFSDQTPAATLEMFLKNHNAQVGDDKKIELGQVTVTKTVGYHYVVNYDKTMDCIADKLIGKFGGEIQLRDKDGKVYIDYLDSIGHGTDMTIELAVNLKSISREVDETAVITRLYPLGAKKDDTDERVSISAVNGGVAYLQNDELAKKYGVICGTQTWDDITTPAMLLSTAKTWFKTANLSKTQYQITALDLSQIDKSFEQFELGCWYRVKNSLMGIDADLRIIGVTIDIDSPQSSQLTFGDKFETLSGFMTAKTQSIQSTIEDNEFKNRQVVNAKIDNATKLITGASGGHIVLDPPQKPERILIMDTENINTCKSCIQLNKNGLGFWKSSDGGSAKDGPYTNAWTIDGNLVASFITALTLTGLKINNGSGTFSVSEDGTVVANKLSSKSANITGGSINVQTSSQNTSAIKLSHKNWSISVSPLEIRVENTDIGGHLVFQAGAINCYWNSELKVNIDSNSGDIRTYGGNKTSFFLDTNNRSISVYDEENQKRTVYIEGNTGTVYAKNFQKTT